LPVHPPRRTTEGLIDTSVDATGGFRYFDASMRPQGRPCSSQLSRRCERLAGLEERVWLVIDDVHELGSPDALQQLELLVMRAPSELRFVLATRHAVRLACTICASKAG
jgi:ATP/maltotriose-dependent transcriptional regulator MalT